MALHTDSAAVQCALAERRNALFRETVAERFERIALGTAWAAHPARLSNLPALARLWVSDLVKPETALPDPELTLNCAGLVGMVRDVSVPTLLAAYRDGLFTHAHYGPLKWYSLNERCVLFFNELHVGKTVRRALRQQRFEVTFDRDFESVIKACAGRRPGKWHVTWITPQIMRAYADLFDAGHVHSFEVWDESGALVGGGYGLALGGVFFTESQFSLTSNTSKIGFTALNWHLAKWGFVLNDGKWTTPTMTEMGFRTIPRAEFRMRLAVAARPDGRPGRWQAEADLKTIADWQPRACGAQARATTDAA